MAVYFGWKPVHGVETLIFDISGLHKSTCLDAGYSNKAVSLVLKTTGSTPWPDTSLTLNQPVLLSTRLALRKTENMKMKDYCRYFTQKY